MLTSAARETLTGVQTVIVDEIHAIAATKRGAHLALSLERLDDLCQDRPAQRIGLSATVRPPEELARFLSGHSPTTIVAPPSAKTFELTVQVPVPDMANLANNTIWPDVEARLVDLIESHSSTIVFANSRRLAERLTARLNEIHAERSGGAPTGGRATRRSPAGRRRTSWPAGKPIGAPPLLARAHHGSVSKEQRALVEEDLKRGRLKAVVATSSLELGIDMGAVDLVIQVEAPPSVASGLQRIGRAGHQVGEISRGVLFPKHRTDLIGCAVSVQRMLAGQIETMRVPANPLDILAQHTVAAAALEPLDADRWFDTVRRSAPFATLPRSVFEATLDLLSGKYPSTEFAELRPRLVYDRDAGTLTARPGAQRLAVTSGGAIPDRGLFTVYLASEAEKPSRVGELDEEMVYESRPGDVISLGATSWRITEITHDRVLVIPAPGQPARLPFWRGDTVGRPAELGAALGAFTGELAGLDRGRIRQSLCGFRFRRLRNRQPVAAAGRAANRHRGGAHRHHAAGRAVPRRAGRLAGDPALPVRAAGARAARAGRGPAAARTLRHRRETHRLRRRHRGAAARHASKTPLDYRRRTGPSCSSSTPTRSTRSSPPRWAARRCSRPGSGNARPAPCCCPAGTPAALAAVASAPARRPVARRGPQVPRLPDRAGDRPGMPAGRLRRPDAGRADGRYRPAQDPGPGSRNRDALAVRRFAAVRLRRRVHVRGRQPDWPNAAPRRCRWTARCWPNCSAGWSCASCSIPRSSPRPAANCNTCPTTGLARDAEAVADLLRLLGPADRRRGRRPASWAPRLRGRRRLRFETSAAGWRACARPRAR